MSPRVFGDDADAYEPGDYKGRDIAGEADDKADEEWFVGEWMQTFTGAQFFPTHPKVENVNATDIAHALSLICRYGGHVDRFYSVAEHCVLLSRWLEAEGFDSEVQLVGLLHDATEAYVGDMVRPLKKQLVEYREAEDKVQRVIWQKFNLPWTMYDLSGPQDPFTHEAVKDGDTRICLDERNALMSRTRYRWGVDDSHTPLGVTVVGWYPPVAELQYIKRLRELGVDV